ncbi:MAG: ArgR family transcriptional regulator [Furfurilactobacillus sp.]|jgi:transcriptional regulator of arginine metabolism|uniref:Arginine repressor n=1 Tax=Furfurilactobacillus milii TaxID=2888272 RepID=A0ABT6D8A3_9LACO|nr:MULTISPECIES: ArgR family transcriptional regulator [Furfurilactobacillus]QLE66666.1 arginine catabolic regulator [Furfurilactobacillus rossiae]MCF6160552.1 ArgR family transcriptional regulator [Furfurilactobacillus milii]MCF6162784.1 ArgR family transcriptional regulator [Furfurilactobacillus milii]MCF6419855.1 ArgR family transcriptional regulator [Furfurilactobacillus milii]MCH4010629.1 ArgR family transcriptional regulator [Furfurilactobacillus sp.]
MKKRERQAIIRRVIVNNAVHTQTELVLLLDREGLDVTQATISRDITEMQLIKVPDENGRTYYTFSTDRPIDGESKLRRNLNGNVIDMTINNQFCLLNVLPGNGPVIASLIKQMNYDEVFGVLSDDSTVLIIASTIDHAVQVRSRLAELGAE